MFNYLEDHHTIKKFAKQNPNEDKELDAGGKLRDGEQGEAGQVGGEVMEEEILPSRVSGSMAAHPRGSMQAEEALLLLQGGQAMDTVEQGQRREVPEGGEESMRKSQRLDEDAPISEPETKKIKTLYPPTFAGQVRQVIEDVEIYVDEEEEVEWQIEDEIDLTEYSEKDGPPEVSKEQLEELDKEAMLKEVAKLKEMEVKAFHQRCQWMMHYTAIEVQTEPMNSKMQDRSPRVQRQREHSGYFCTNYAMECSEDITGFGNSDEAQCIGL